MKTPRQLKKLEESKKLKEIETHRIKVTTGLEKLLVDAIFEGAITSTGGRLSLGGFYDPDDVKLMKRQLDTYGWRSCIESETVYGYSMTCRSETESTHYYLRLKPKRTK